MYNTSGSDIDIEEFEYHSGSRKVRKQIIMFYISIYIFLNLGC
jgi:hypothetical protein